MDPSSDIPAVGQTEEAGLPRRPRWISREVFIRDILPYQADAGLRAELQALLPAMAPHRFDYRVGDRIERMAGVDRHRLERWIRVEHARKRRGGVLHQPGQPNVDVRGMLFARDRSRMTG